MGFFRRVSQLFSDSVNAESVKERDLVRSLINKARRAQYAEQYDEALDLLSQAMEIVEQKNDLRTKVDITLSRADILTTLQDYDTAHFILDELREDSIARQLNAPLAYSLCSLGVLEQKRGNLTEAQELFETAREKADAIKTDGASGRATAHLGDLYFLEGNASYAVYLLEDAIEKLNRSGDRELLGYFLGQLGLAQIQNGQGEEGEIRLQRGLDLAMTIGHMPQIRNLNYLLGQQASKKGNFPRAKSFFENVLALYPEPPPETIDYALLLCQMSQLSLRSGHIDEARKQAELALAIAESLSAKNLVTMARGSIGLAKYANKEDGALSYLEEAVRDYADMEADSFYIDTLRTLASAQIEAGNIEGGITSYENATKQASNLPDEAGQAHHELAHHYAKSGGYRKAIEQWQDAISNFEKANRSEEIVRAYCDIADMYDRIGDGRMAQRDYGKALEMLSQVSNNQVRGRILARIANAYHNYGEIPSARDFYKESIEIAENHVDTEAKIVRQANYARLLALTDRPQKALTQLMQVQINSEKAELEQQLAIILAYIGLAYMMTNDYETADEHYQHALEQFMTLDAPQWEARVYANRGDNALNAYNLEQAETYYQTAYALAQTHELVDVLIQASIGQARVAIQNDDLDSAQEKLSKIDSIAHRLNYSRLLAIYHQAWSQYYAKQGEPETASSSWEKSQKYRKMMQMASFIPDWL